MKSASITPHCLWLLLLLATIPALALPPQAKDTPPASRFAKLDTLRVHYQSYGQGQEALVFVHGWSCNLSFWKANLAAFTTQTRVIALDLPGHGESDKPEVAYTMEMFARAVDAVLRDAGVERAVLVGHSLGTPVIRQFYRLYPGKVRGLVIVDGALRPFGTRESMEPLLAQFRGPNHRQAVEQFVGFIAQSMKNPQTLSEIKAAMLATPQHVVIGAMERLFDPAIWKEDKINVPTLALMAKNEQLVTPEYEKFARALVPGLDYQVWEGVSHFLMMDEPQKFNDAPAAFLRKHKLVK
jgi:pimeloyl-ACP methyl ester carboxylesterase